MLSAARCIAAAAAAGCVSDAALARAVAVCGGFRLVLCTSCSLCVCACACLAFLAEFEMSSVSQLSGNNGLVMPDCKNITPVSNIGSRPQRPTRPCRAESESVRNAVLLTFSPGMHAEAFCTCVRRRAAPSCTPMFFLMMLMLLCCEGPIGCLRVALLPHPAWKTCLNAYVKPLRSTVHR